MFQYYDTKPVKVIITTQEILASLTGEQKIAILDGFVKGIKAKTLGYAERIKLAVVQYLYKKIDEIEEASRSLMKGEVIITPEVIDPITGKIITSAVYNNPPASAEILLNEIQDAFLEDFTSGQVIAILTKMVEYSKYQGNADWKYYAENVVK